jgi:hypothetical protein
MKTWMIKTITNKTKKNGIYAKKREGRNEIDGI